MFISLGEAADLMTKLATALGNGDASINNLSFTTRCFEDHEGEEVDVSCMTVHVSGTAEIEIDGKKETITYEPTTAVTQDEERSAMIKRTFF